MEALPGMSGPATYRHLDHTADIAIEAEAPDGPALFAICGRALFDIIAGEEARIEERGSLRLEIEAPDAAILLQRWLRELLYLHDVGHWLFRGFEIAMEVSESGALRLHGEARGESYDPARHHLETEIKAVTYHMLSAGPDAAGRWRARVIFDI